MPSDPTIYDKKHGEPSKNPLNASKMDSKNFPMRSYSKRATYLPKHYSKLQMLVRTAVGTGRMKSEIGCHWVNKLREDAKPGSFGGCRFSGFQ